MKSAVALVLGGACLLGAWAVWSSAVERPGRDRASAEAHPRHAPSARDGAPPARPAPAVLVAPDAEPPTEDVARVEAAAARTESKAAEDLAYALLLEAGTPEQLVAEAERLDQAAAAFAQPELEARHARGLSRVVSTEVGPSHYEATREERKLFIRVFMPQSGGTYVATLPKEEYPQLYASCDRARALRILAVQREGERARPAAK